MAADRPLAAAPVARLAPRHPSRREAPADPVPPAERLLAREDLSQRLRGLSDLLAGRAAALGPEGEAIARLARRLGRPDLGRAALQMAEAARAARAGGPREAVALAATAARVARLGALG